MFLISFVALLGLVNVASADIVWEGDISTDWCDGENWAGGSVPGPDDRAIIPDTDGNDPLIQGPGCSADFGDWEFDTGGGDSAALNIVDAIVRFKELRDEGEGGQAIHISGTSNVDCWKDRMRPGDDAAFLLTVSDTAFLHVNGDIRGGDSGDGNFDFIVTGGTIVTEGEILCGDDGGGTFDFSGGSITCNKNMLIAARRAPAVGVLQVSGDVEIFVKGFITLGKDCKDNPGSPSMVMTGGTVNTNQFLVAGHEDFCGDASLDMQGGLLVCRSDLIVDTGDANKATVTLSGGEIQILGDDSLEIGDNGSMDITDGTLILNGDALAEVWGYAMAGKLTGCGGAQGLIVDYGVTNPGKTTVTATCVFCGCCAWFPQPYDGSTGVGAETCNLVLSWQPGERMGGHGRHLVYFSTDADCVANGDMGSPCYMGFQRATDLDYDVGMLPLWTTYYWRVDEGNEDGTTCKGAVWSFTTGCEVVPADTNADCLVNFKDFACVAGTLGEQQMWPQND